MANGVFITGTDTGVGKTVISCALAALLNKRLVNTGVMKPIETGCNYKKGELFPKDAANLKTYSKTSDRLEDISPCRFKSPLAPMAASIVEGKKVNLKKIKISFEHIKRIHDFLIIEGIGGLLVPITKNFLVSDLIKSFNLPVIIVCHPGLGTLNHTLLTFREAKRSNLKIKGLVINNYDYKSRNLAYRTNPKIIENLLKPEFIILFPKLKNIGYDSLLNAAEKHLNKAADILLENGK